jgi:nitroreductase
VRDREKVRSLAEGIRDSIRESNLRELTAEEDFFATYFEKAPVVVACAWRPSCIEPDWEETVQADPVVQREAIMVGLLSLGHAMENSLLAATALGLGAGYIGPCHDMPRFEEILSLEKPFTVAAIVPIGYPAREKQKETIDKTDQVRTI